MTRDLFFEIDAPSERGFKPFYDFIVGDDESICCAFNRRVFSFGPDAIGLRWRHDTGIGRSVQLRTDGEVFVSRSEQGSSFLSLRTGEIVRSFPHLDMDQKHVCSPDSPWIVSHRPRPGEFPDELVLFDATDGRKIAELSSATDDEIVQLMLSQDGKVICTVEVFGLIQVWDVIGK